jgi:hypothetical protein
MVNTNKLYKLLLPLSFTQYQVINKPLFEILEKPTIIVVSHNRPNPELDRFIMNNEIIENNITAATIAKDFLPNKINDFIVNLSYDKAFPIYVKTGTCKKAVNVLKEGNHVIIFLFQNDNKSGVYYIQKQSTSPVVLAKIKKTSASEKLRKTFTLEYQSFNYDGIDDVDQYKDQLYKELFN